MPTQYFHCPKCNYQNTVGNRFCPNCGVQYKLPTAARQNIIQQRKTSWFGLSIAFGLIGLSVLCALIGSVNDKKKINSNNQTEVVQNTNQIASVPATPTPTPSFTDLKARTDSLMKFSKDEYLKEDLKQFDDVMTPLNNIPKEDKNYKEAQKLHKKLIDKVAPIAAEIVILGPKPKNSEWDGSVQPVVDYLKANLNDYEDSEWLEWSPVTKIMVGKEPFWAVRLKLRARNAFGAKILKDVIFFIRNEKVVQTTGL